MLTETITIKAGDKTQLNYMREEYNYLLAQKWEMDEALPAAIQQRKAIAERVKHYSRIKERMLQVDAARTNLFLTQNNKP